MIKLPHTMNESYPPMSGNVITEMYKLQKKFTEKYMRDDLSLI